MNTESIKSLRGKVVEYAPVIFFSTGILFIVNFFIEKAEWYEMLWGGIFLVAGIVFWRSMGGWKRILKDK